MARVRIEKNDLTIWHKIQIEFFKELCDLFEKFEVNYWVDGGTLLGLIRDGELIPHDSDQDVCMKIEDYGKNVIEMFDYINSNSRYDFKEMRSLHEYFKSGFNNGKIFVPNKHYKILLKERFISGRFEKKIYCDFIVLFPFKDFHFYKQNSEYVWRYKSEYFEKIVTKRFYDRNVKIPSKYNEYLDMIYNYSWREPGKFNAYTTKYWTNWETYKDEIPSDYCYEVLSS